MVELYNKIKKSFVFRYQHWQNKKKIKSLGFANKLHDKKMKTILANDFTIISSNCWGGSVYEDLNLPYKSPTIGLFFYAPCYINFLKNLKTNINLPLTFVETSKYEDANVFRRNEHSYPIGKLGDDIEIQFLHYKTKEEALEKWERRKQRINWDNLFVSCTDRDGMTQELMEEFDSLPYQNKVLFTGQNYENIKSVQYLKAFGKDKMVGDIYTYRYAITQSFDLKEWLNYKV